MSVSFDKKEEFKKYVGYFEGEVIAVNPDMDKLLSMGFKADKEPEYLKDIDDKVIELDENGKPVEKDKTIKQLNLTFYIQDKETKNIFRTNFFLKDKIQWNKDKTKRQFINSDGNSSWAIDESGLHKFMTEKGQEIRVGRVGEGGDDGLYDFVRKWMNKGYFKGEFSWSDLMKGKVKEIAELIKNDNAGTITCPAVVRTTEEGKEYQQIYNKGITPGYVMKTVRLQKIDEAFIEKAEEAKKAKSATALQKSVLLITDREHGCKDHYFLGKLKEYDETENFVNGNEAYNPQDSGY